MTTVVYEFRHWPKRRYAAHNFIVLHSVQCWQNVFDVHAQMLKKVNDTEIFVPLCLYSSSQYTNSRAQPDCTDCVTVWMTLTVGGLRCEVGEFWDIMWVVERSFCGIFECRYVEGRTDLVWIVERSLCGILECRYVEGRTNILQETEILTSSQFIRQIVHIHWEDQRNDSLYIGISELM